MRLAAEEDSKKRRKRQGRFRGGVTAVATAINPVIGAAMRSQTPRYEGDANNYNALEVEKRRIANRPRQQQPQMNQQLQNYLLNMFRRRNNNQGPI